MSDLVTASNNQDTNYVSLAIIIDEILDHSSEHQMEKEVEVIYCPERKVFEYKQNKFYKIPEDIHSSWPKFYAIEIEENDRNIVTLSFRNNPNTANIVNLLQMADSSYELKDFDAINNIKIKLLTIKTNTDASLAYLFNKYSEFSIEAASHLWEVYRTVIANSMDKKNPKWKSALSHSIDAWADEETFSEESKCIDENSSRNFNFGFDFDNLDKCRIKSIYRDLTSQKKSKFKAAVYNHYIFNEAVNFTNSILKDRAFNPFEHSLNNYTKCTSFISHNLPIYQGFIIDLQKKSEDIFAMKFEPSFFEKITDEKKWDKHLKSANSLSKSGLSIVDKVILSGKYSKSFSKISPLFDGAAFLTSIYYFSKEFYNTENRNDAPQELDEKILGKNLITIDFICNTSFFSYLDEENTDKLLKFYAEFSKFKLDNEPQIAMEINPAFHILQNMTDISYLKSTDFYSIAVKIVINANNQNIPLINLLENKNLTSCIEETNNILSGKAVNIYPDSKLIAPYEENITNYTSEDLTTSCVITLEECPWGLLELYAINPS